MPFCTNKTSNFLVTKYFYGGIVVPVCAYQRGCFPCSCSLSFFHCRSFSPCWPLAFLFFSPPLWNFHVFLPTKFVSFVFNHSLWLFLCYPRECKRQKWRRKRHDFVVTVFSLSLSPGDFLPNKTLSCNLGCHKCWLSYFILVWLWCERTGSRAEVRSRDY